MIERLTRSRTRLAPAALVAAFILGASSAPAQTASPGEPSKARLTTLDVGGMDSGTQACTDFYQYANGGWLDGEPDPLGPAALGHVRRAAPAQPERPPRDPRAAGGRPLRRGGVRGAQARRLLRRSCMDEAAIEAKGLDADRAGARPDRSDPERRRTARRDRPAAGSGGRRRLRVRVGGGPEGLVAGHRGGPPGRARAAGPRLLPEERREVGRAPEEVHRARREDAGARRRDTGRRPPPTRRRSRRSRRSSPQASMDNVDIRDPDKTHHPMSLEAFSRTNAEPRVGRPSSASRDLPADVSINVWQPDFFRAADRLLKSVPLATWKTYLRWHLLNAVAPRFRRDSWTRTSRSTEPRWPAPRRSSRAGSAASTRPTARWGWRSGRIYVKEHFPPEAKRRADELVKNLLAALADDIKTLSWMSEPTKKAALKKVEAFGTKIGYPDKWRDYSTLQVSRALLRGQRDRRRPASSVRRDFAKIGKPVDKYRLGDDAAGGQRVQQLGEERDRLPGRDPAAAVLLPGGGRRHQLRRRSAR